MYRGIGKGCAVFSPDSRKVAYIACVASAWNVVFFGTLWKIVVDGLEQAKCADGGGTLSFSPDSLNVGVVRERTP